MFSLVGSGFSYERVESLESTNVKTCALRLDLVEWRCQVSPR